MAFYNESPFPKVLKEESAELIYWLLVARFGNDHISSTDTTRFELRLNSIIWQHGPRWEKMREVQERMKELDLDSNDVLVGTTAIHNLSLNPSIAPTTDTLDELTTVNQQNTTKYKRSKIEGWSMLVGLMREDVTENFLYRFRELFSAVIYGPELLYKEVEHDDYVR